MNKKNNKKLNNIPVSDYSEGMAIGVLITNLDGDKIQPHINKFREDFNEGEHLAGLSSQAIVELLSSGFKFQGSPQQSEGKNIVCGNCKCSMPAAYEEYETSYEEQFRIVEFLVKRAFPKANVNSVFFGDFSGIET